MNWRDIKSLFLAKGSANLTGAPADEYISKSTAGPGAGGPGSFFLNFTGKRVRMSIDPLSEIICIHQGKGAVTCSIAGETIHAMLEKPGLHCPRQAYITVTSQCIFHCKYCSVPNISGRKTLEEIETMITSVLPDIDAISLTSGVLTTIEEEEAYVLSVIHQIRHFSLPIGVSIYPTPDTPALLKEAGVAEVKFNLETATGDLFTTMCPGLVRTDIEDALVASVPLFGRGHVFSNIIFGLGETDEELATCITNLAQKGVIAVLRPLHPAAEVASYSRPSPERIKKIFLLQHDILAKYHLLPSVAMTMCPACAGCDMIPGVD